MSHPAPDYLEEGAAILRQALKAAEERYKSAMNPSAEDRGELLEIRLRIAGAFARLHAAGGNRGAACVQPDPEPQS